MPRNAPAPVTVPESDAPAPMPAIGAPAPAPRSTAVDTPKRTLSKDATAARLIHSDAKAVMPLLRVFWVELVELTQLTDVSIVQQTFTAQFYIEFVIEGGALDPTLCEQSDAFPFGEDGKPTFRPSALWYLEQTDFNNAKAWRKLDGKMVKAGQDLLLTARFEGTFFESMELQRFPFDAQDLTMSLAINCRTSGMTPVDIRVRPDAALNHVIEMEHFVLHTEWELEPKLSTRCHLVGSENRQFPSLDISSIVRRRPAFYMLNIVYPICLFAFLANFQFALPRYSTSDRMSMSTSLLLTSVAFKYTISSMLPAISYITILDRVLLACGGVIVLNVIEAGWLGIQLCIAVEAVLDDLDPPDFEDPKTGMDKAAGRALHSFGTGDTAEELMWLVSRQTWAKHLDRASVLLNVVLLMLILAYTQWEMKQTHASANARTAAAQESALTSPASRSRRPSMKAYMKASML